MKGKVRILHSVDENKPHPAAQRGGLTALNYFHGVNSIYFWRKNQKQHHSTVLQNSAQEGALFSRSVKWVFFMQMSSNCYQE